MAEDRLAEEFVRLCEKARAGGLLQLRADADEAELLAVGLRGVVQGNDPPLVRAAMERKIAELDPHDPAPLRRLIVGVLAVQRGDRPHELRALLTGA
jgi:flagellar motor component MotA